MFNGDPAAADANGDAAPVPGTPGADERGLDKEEAADPVREWVRGVTM